MQSTRTPTAIFLTCLLLTFVSSIHGQKQRPRPKPGPRPVVAQAPTFENLLSVDSYKIYVEIRNAGQLLSSNSVGELLEPIMKLAGPPKELRTTVKWLMRHTEPIMTSRMLLATWPTARNIPDVLIAIEFDNAEEAAKFEPQLNEFLPKVLPPAVANPSNSPVAEGANTNQKSAQPSTPAQPAPTFVVNRAGSLVFITNSPLTLKNLKPLNSRPLSEDQNFRMAHDRFSTEPIFAFLNLKAIEKEEEERREKAIEERKNEATARRDVIEEGQEKTQPEQPEELPPPEVSQPKVETPNAVIETTPQHTPPDPLMLVLSQLGGVFFSGTESKWPDAIGFGANLDAASFDVRALLVNSAAAAEKTVAIPFFPILIPGPSIVPESPNVLPADTELFVAASLDLPQIYAALTSKPAIPVVGRGSFVESADETESQTPFAVLEKKLGIKFQTDLLPLIGNEIVFSMPVAMADVGPKSATPFTNESNSKKTDTLSEPAGPRVIVAISLRDKEGMRALLPKIVDGLSFSGASRMAQTEKREETEIVSYANVVSYAFIGNFLIVSPEVKAVRHVVDSYLKRETLASDSNFKNFTRWQPRQLQGQLYVSPALMESYKSWVGEPNTLISDQTRDLLSRLTLIAEPVTYSLSNEGTGPLHQVRIPKNLVLMAITGISGEMNPPPMIANERVTLGALYTIAYAQSTIRSEKGSYATLDELVDQKKISREVLENHGYKVYLNITSDGFEAVAVPTEYGKTGKLSYFVNETHVVRSGDHGGGPATVADRPVQ